MNSIFDNENLNEQLKHLELNPPKHYISVLYGNIKIPDYNDPHVYCLFRRTGDETYIILSETMTDYKEFTQTIDNLEKYFKAERIIFKHD